MNRLNRSQLCTATPCGLVEALLDFCSCAARSFAWPNGNGVRPAEQSVVSKPGRSSVFGPLDIYQDARLRYSNAGYTGASYTMYYLHPPTYFVDLIVHFESPKLDVSQIKMTFEEGAVCNSHQGTCDLQCPPLDFDDNSLDLHIPRLSNRCSFPFHSTSIGFSETRDKRPKRKIIWCHFIMPT